MAYNNSNDKVAVQEWSNSLAYLQRISAIEDLFIIASTQEDVQNMILQIRNLVMVLKRMNKSSKNRTSSVFNPEDKGYWQKRLEKARNLYKKSLESDMGSRAVRNFNNIKRNEALEVLREIYEDLGDFQMKNNLTFKEGIDPWNAVFEG